MAAITWTDVTNLPGATADGLANVSAGFQLISLAWVNGVLDVSMFDGEDGNATKIARAALVAHVCASLKLGQAGGAVKAESDGKLEREYQQIVQNPGLLSTTGYGRTYLLMINGRARGPRLL